VFETDGVSVDPRVAGFWIRATARTIDTAVAFVLGVVAGIIAFIVLAIGRQPGNMRVWAQHMGGFSLVALLGSTLASALYHTASEFVGGASLGKLICGLRVVSEDFTPVSFRGALIRSFAFVVDGFFFGYVGYRRMNVSPLAQRYGDHWGGTTVVSVRNYRQAVRGPVLVLLGLGMGMAAMVIFQAVFIVARVVNAMR